MQHGTIPVSPIVSLRRKALSSFAAEPPSQQKGSAVATTTALRVGAGAGTSLVEVARLVHVPPHGFASESTTSVKR
eukprot:5295089-Prymnesium_polylepis.2